MSGPETNELIEKLEAERKMLTEELRNVNAKLIERYEPNAKDVHKMIMADGLIEYIENEITTEINNWRNVVGLCEANRLIEYKIPIHIIKNRIEFVLNFYLY